MRKKLNLIRSIILFLGMLGHVYPKNISVSEIKVFLQKLPICHVYDFSPYGYFGYFPEFTNDLDIDVLNMKITDKATWVSTPFLNQNESVANRYKENLHNAGFILSSEHKKNVQRLIRHMQSNGFKSLHLRTLTKVAKENILTRKESEGECFATIYVGSVLEGRNLLAWENVSSSVYSTIKGYFSYPDPTVEQLTENEYQAYQAGELSLQEINELRAIRESTLWLEKNTRLKLDRGGWSGNLTSRFDRYGSKCGEEAITYFYFIRRLQADGVLRYFQQVNKLAVKSVAYINNHAGTLLANKRTKSLFVLDSWVKNGGNPASVLPFEDWLKNHKDGNYSSDILSQCKE